ncbi:tensin-3-like [Sinocyclocheilus grahami]|uniref:tensin-3-like n=1 Tax=Sinocyclocheilus grahami TaxID=75366 RepID=UPI0007ACA3B1|nr:PREDICTED: tensin-3-like [Sinocyclocheilus grahami]
MEEGYELDLTYVTERIIAVSFPQDCFEETYLRNLRDVTRMLKSKHTDNYLVINLSERKQELTKMNPKTLDTGWPDFHAPPLDKICSICKAIENWLNADPLHVVVIHCRGGKGRIGVVISCFVHFTDVSARYLHSSHAPTDLTLSHYHRRSSTMNTSPLFLHCIIIHGVPHFDPAGVCQPYLKVYQGTQVVYVSGVYHVGAAHRDRICIALEPAQLLKGDILVDDSVPFTHSESRSSLLSPAAPLHPPAVVLDRCSARKYVETVDDSVPFTHSESRSSLLSPAAPLHPPAVVLDRCSARSATLSRAQQSTSSSPDHTLSASSDSGLSSASLRTDGWPRTPQPSQQERVELKRLLSGFGLDETSRGCAATEPPVSPAPLHLNGRLRPKERETDILDDEALTSRHDLHSVDSLGTLSSSCHQSSQNSLLSDGFGSPSRADEPQTHAAAGDESERRAGFAHRGASLPVSSPRHVFQHAGYSTQTWVHQQQLVAAQQYLYLPGEDATEHMQQLLPKPAVLDSGPSSPVISQSHDTDKKHDEEFSSLTLDIDNSIHQLNQLILDLDPTFVPVSTKPSGFSGADRNGHPQTDGTHQRENRFIMSPKTDLSGARGETAWTLNLTTTDGNTLTTAAPHTQHAAVFRADGVQYSSHSSLDTGSDVMPATPAFPITPPTPYVKSMMGYSPFRQAPSPSFGSCRAEHEMRETAVFMGASDEGFQHHRPFVAGVTAFSDRSADCVSFAPSSVPSLSAPDAHSSPLSGPRARVLQQTFEEKFSLGPALEGLDYQQKLLLASDGEHSQGSASPSGFSSPHSGSSLSIPFPSVLPELQSRANPAASDQLSSKPLTVKFVQDTSKHWYKPDLARDQAIAVLKDKEPGSFIVRDSHSFRGAYGLAMKVTTPPPSALQSRRGVDLSSELVRHFLIECSPRGVRLKGCPNEPYFGSLSALVCQHSITPLALPCKLIIPDRDPLEDAVSASPQSITNSASELLKQGAACNVWFLGSVEMESLTGFQAVQKATTAVLSADSLPSSTVVHFKVSSQGITLTDNQRKLFFRRHYAANTVIFCALDPQDRRWRRDGCGSAKILGFVARKAGSGLENVCHVFAEHDPEQPASAIVNFVSKVMIGSQKM